MNKSLNYLVVGGAMFLGASVITTSINLTVIGCQYLVETIENKIVPYETRNLNLKFKDKKELLLPVTHGTLDVGEFETLDGKIMQLYDSNKVSYGKIFSNTYVHNLKKDSTYDIKLVGNDFSGYTILGVSRNN